jgi:hypothetical protein
MSDVWEPVMSDKLTDKKARQRLAKNIRRVLARPLQELPCGCRQRVLTSRDMRRGAKWRAGFRKGTEPTWALCVWEVCREHREELPEGVGR